MTFWMTSFFGDFTIKESWQGLQVWFSFPKSGWVGSGWVGSGSLGSHRWAGDGEHSRHEKRGRNTEDRREAQERRAKTLHLYHYGRTTGVSLRPTGVLDFDLLNITPNRAHKMNTKIVQNIKTSVERWSIKQKHSAYLVHKLRTWLHTRVQNNESQRINMKSKETLTNR